MKLGTFFPPSMLAFLSLLLLTVSCGSSDQQGGVSAPGFPGSTWLGNYTPSDSSNGTAQKVRLSFFGDDTFEIAAADQSLTSMAKGSYSDMPNMKNLSLNIVESNYNLFGNAGTTKVYEYQIQGNEMLLQNPGGKYLLTREDGDSGDGGDEQRPLDGDWYCQENGGGRWSINISGSSFRANRSPSQGKTIYFEGGVSVIANTSEEVVSVLDIKESNYGPLKGTKLRAELLSDTSMNLAQIDKESGKKINEGITCNR